MECVFSSYYEFNSKRNKQMSKKKDINTIESKLWQERLQKKLASLLENYPKLKVKYLLPCTNKYFFTKAVFKDKPAQKRSCWSDESEFDPRDTISILWFKIWSEMWSKTPQQMETFCFLL